MKTTTISDKSPIGSRPKTWKSWGLTILFLLGLSLACTAQRRVSLADCLRMARENNLSVKAGGIAVERAKALQGTAFDLDKTGITLSQDPTGGGSPDNALQFSQTIAFPTVYGAKRKLLKEETELERTRLELTTQEVEKSVATEYCNLLYTIERRHILMRQAEIYKRFQFLADTKLKYGETGKLEQMNAHRLGKENEMALRNADKDVETARLRLQQLLNTSETIAPMEDSLVVLYGQDELSADPSPATQPLSRMLEQRQRVARQGVKVARQGFMPDISVAASTQLLIKGWNPYDVDRSRFEKGNFMGFEVGVSVPLFYGAQKARLKAAKHDAELAETQATQQLRQYETLRQAAQNELLKAQESLNYYQEQGLREAEELERISQVSYEKGAIGYVEYIQNLQTAAEMRNSRAAAVNEFNLAAINLKYINATNSNQE